MQNQLQDYQSMSIQNESQFDYSTNAVSSRSQMNNCDNAYDSSETEEVLSELSSSEKEDFYSTEEVSNKCLALRASTAPARPLSDIEEFRRSSDFLLLEHTVICASQLIRTEDMKYDLDSDEGQIACKKLLNQIERLCDVFKVSCMSRSYRKGFSNAYRVLYKEGQLCYLTEILDSAQEGFPYLYVNGEKYLFSNEVLEAGNKLYVSFSKIQNSFRDIYNKICDETSTGVVAEIIESLKKVLQDFDADWVDFEHLYVHELMVIETDARRFISESIGMERELSNIEAREKAKGKMIYESEEYNSLREKLVTMIGKINSVANIEGKGRDDLTLDILIAAEGITRRMSSAQTSPLRSLAEKIRNSFSAYRCLLKKYEANIEVVDPQLKNNSDLVEALTKFEESWERGKTYILNAKRYNRVVYVHNFIEKTAEKYELFKQQLDCSDSELFVTIPGLLVLQTLEDDKGICRYFCSSMYDETDEIGIV